MSGILVLAGAGAGVPVDAACEAIGAARELAAGGYATMTVRVAILDPEPSALAGALSVGKVEEIIEMRTAAPFESHIAEALALGLLDAERPDVVLAAHTVDSLAYLPAVALRAGCGFAGDIVELRWEDGVRASRPAYGEKLLADLAFDATRPVILTLRAGSFAPATGAAQPTRRQAELDGGAPRLEHVRMREPVTGAVDITTAELLVSVGRGAESRENVERLAVLAERMGGMLATSRPPVDAGWVDASRLVGQSGRTVKPKVYLAMGISGAVQHVAGMRDAATIIAVNRDPEAAIFGVAHYGVVGDLLELADELARHFE